MTDQTLVAAALGTIEGLTEFVPVSSTAHLLLAARAFGFQSPGGAFEVLIQLGAIMALLAVYAGRLAYLFGNAHRDPQARRFILAVTLAFLPAVVIGVQAHGFIKRVLFDSPLIIATALIVGGFILLFVDRMAVNPRYHRAEDFPLPVAFGIGVVQCLAMIPGVSRSGATIVGALLLGADKRSAAEFSFFLSIPTMLGAFVYDLMKNRELLDAAALSDIAVGFAAAFIAGLLVVRWLLGYVSRNGYALFAWWRIVAGAIVFAVYFLT